MRLLSGLELWLGFGLALELGLSSGLGLRPGPGSGFVLRLVLDLSCGWKSG